jgi:hypothetical protein
MFDGTRYRAAPVPRSAGVRTASRGPSVVARAGQRRLAGRSLRSVTVAARAATRRAAAASPDREHGWDAGA